MNAMKMKLSAHEAALLSEACYTGFEVELDGSFIVDKVIRCLIPDDCIDKKRYPLFIARAALRELVQSMQTTGRL